MEKQVPNLIAALWAIGFLAAILIFSRLVRPDRKDETVAGGFDSGEPAPSRPWIRFSARYQALLVIATIFFLGAILMYPAVAAFRAWVEEGHGVAALVGLMLFLGTLTVALAHAWTKGDLGWVRDVEKASRKRNQ